MTKLYKQENGIWILQTSDGRGLELVSYDISSKIVDETIYIYNNSNNSNLYIGPISSLCDSSGVSYGTKENLFTQIGDFFVKASSDGEAFNELESKVDETIIELGNLEDRVDNLGVEANLEPLTTEVAQLRSDLNEKTNISKILNIDKYPTDISEIVDNPEFLIATHDAEGRLLESTNKSGEKSFYSNVLFKGGLPSQIIEALLSKIDSADGMSLIDSLISNSYNVVSNEEWLYAVLSNDNKFIFGINHLGEFVWSAGIPPVVSDYVTQYIYKNIGLRHSVNSLENNAVFDRPNASLNKIDKAYCCNSVLLGYSSWPQYYNNINTYIDIIKNLQCSVVRMITFMDVITYNENTHAWELTVATDGTIVQDVFDTMFYYLFKNNIDICLSTASLVYLRDFYDEDKMNKWFHIIEYLANRYNGTTAITPKNNITEPPLLVKVKYWELTNEINTKTTSPQTCFSLQKRYYNLLKGIDSSFIILSAGTSAASLLENRLSTYTDGENYYHDFVDIYNTHVYDYPVSLVPNRLKWTYSNISSILKNKPFWITEFGKNTYNNPDISDIDCANYSFIQMFISLSFGASKCFYWANEYLISDNINTLVYNAINYFNEITQGGTIPIMENANGLNICSFKTLIGDSMAILWSDKDININIECSSRASFFDCLGNAVEIDDFSDYTLSSKVLVIKDSDNINLKIN